MSKKLWVIRDSATKKYVEDPIGSGEIVESDRPIIGHHEVESAKSRLDSLKRAHPERKFSLCCISKEAFRNGLQ